MKALYVLAGLDVSAQARLATWQAHLSAKGFWGTQTRNIPYHISLGKYDVCQESEAIRAMKMAAQHGCFEVYYQQLSIFANGQVLFATPTVNRELLDLKECFGSSHHWAPHTTLLIDEPKTILKALPVAMEVFSAFSSQIDSLYLYEFFPTRHILTLTLET